MMKLLQSERNEFDKKILDTKAIIFGLELSDKTLNTLQSFFGDHLNFITVFNPVWSSVQKISRFSSKEKNIFTRFFMRSQVKLKISPGHKFKLFIKWNEKLKETNFTPEDYKIYATTTGHLKIQLVEKHEKSNIDLLPPMKQYEVAQEIKEKIDKAISNEALKLKVQFNQHKEKDKLAITFEMDRYDTGKIGLLIKEILKVLQLHIFE